MRESSSGLIIRPNGCPDSMWFPGESSRFDKDEDMESLAALISRREQLVVWSYVIIIVSVRSAISFQML